MAWAAWYGMRGVHDSRSSTSFSPHLTSSRTHITGFPWGFPIVSPNHAPYQVNHISTHSLPRFPQPIIPSLRQPVLFKFSTSPGQPFGYLAATLSSWGYPPALDTAKLQETWLPHFPSPRSPSCLSLCGQTPVLITPRENRPALRLLQFRNLSS
jgi:hypothetical protein